MERVIETIRKYGYSAVGLQFPEGLMDHATAVADRISSETNCLPLVCAGPCYGACDLADRRMKEAGADALFHFGHSEIPMKTAIPVHYIECRSDADPLPLLSKNLRRLPKRVGLVSTVQHVHTLVAAKNYLENKGFEVRIGSPRTRAKYQGQVLGCSFSAASSISDSVDAFVYIGSGNFHPLGVALATGKKTLAADVLLGEIRDIDGLMEKMLKQRYAKLAKAMKGESFGIIVGEKKGQMRKALAERIKEKLEAEGKKAYSIHLEEVTPESLMPFRKLDALINTACPRIALEDASKFRQPMLTPVELDVVLGERAWDDYAVDEF